VCYDEFICATWFANSWNLSHSYKCHNSLMCVSWIIRICSMTHVYSCRSAQLWLLLYVRGLVGMWHEIRVWRDSSIWFIFDITYSYVTLLVHTMMKRLIHVPFICMTWLMHVLHVRSRHELETYVFFYLNQRQQTLQQSIPLCTAKLFAWKGISCECWRECDCAGGVAPMKGDHRWRDYGCVDCSEIGM